MEYRFSVHISNQAFQAIYSGQKRYVQVLDDNGLRIQLGADKFIPFLTHSGIHGRFLLITDQANSFVSLQRLT